MRTLAQKAQSDSDLQAVIQATQKLWRRHHLTYAQSRYVAKEVRRALELEQPHSRTRVIERLSRDEERRLIDTAYRLTGTRGLLIKTLFQTGARVSEFVAIEVRDFFFDEQMILIRKAKGGKRRYVPTWPELAQELRTHLRDRPQGHLFETNRHAAFSSRRLQQLVKETADLAGITKRVSPHILRHSVATTLLEHGMPLEQIQQFLGHAQLGTTQRTGSENRPERIVFQMLILSRYCRRVFLYRIQLGRLEPTENMCRCRLTRYEFKSMPPPPLR